MPESTALVPVNYAVTLFETSELMSVINDNLAGDTISVNDLPRIKVPGSAGTIWSYKTSGGDVDTKNLDVIMVGHRLTKNYWPAAYDGKNVPPWCSSDDGGITGVVTEEGHKNECTLGGLCAQCPMNKYGSARSGAGKACKDAKLVFILGEKDILPKVLQVPATSLKPLGDYMRDLTTEGIHYYGVVTRFTIVKVDRPNVPQYGQIEAKLLRQLSAEETLKMRAMVEALKPILSQVKSD